MAPGDPPTWDCTVARTLGGSLGLQREGGDPAPPHHPALPTVGPLRLSSLKKKKAHKETQPH